MKRILWVAALLVASTFSAQAQTGPFFDYVPDGYHLDQGNSGQPGPIFDERGFYAGYYRPRPARQIQPEIAAPAPAPQPEPAPQPSYNYQDDNLGSYNGGYNAGGAYGYGYGGYYGYGSYGSYGQPPRITNPLGVSPGGFPSAAGIPYSPTAPFFNTNNTHTSSHSAGSSGGHFSGSGGGHFSAPSGGGHSSGGSSGGDHGHR